jgi:DNA-directed RNA polymerase specialized sigma24 family protein
VTAQRQRELGGVGEGTDGKPERTWLVSILRHKVCDRFRRKYREPCVSCDSLPRKNGAPCIEESMLWIHETAAECLLPDRRMELNEFRKQARETCPAHTLVAGARLATAI